jgi:hypothetical protein
VDERVRFVMEQARGSHTMTELCEMYNIARETGYYWLRAISGEGWRRCKIETELRDNIPTRRRRKSRRPCWNCGGRT